MDSFQVYVFCDYLAIGAGNGATFALFFGLLFCGKT
jgi:hypothetical protein